MKKPLDVLLVNDVAWDRENPCNDCPFLRTSPYHSGVAASLPGYMESIFHGTFAHTCHKTDNRSAVDGPKNHDGAPQHCAGALLMLLRTGHGLDLQLPFLQAAEAGKLDIQRLAARAKEADHVFTVPELLEFYHIELGKRIPPETPRAKRRRWKAVAKRARKSS